MKQLQAIQVGVISIIGIILGLTISTVPRIMAQNTTHWTLDDTFAAFPPVDITGRGLCVSVAPAARSSWGIEGFVFSGAQQQFGTNALDWYTMHNHQGGIYLYGKEERGEWGLVRVIQGDAWGGTQCATPVRWHVPQPVPADAITGVALNYRVDRATLLTDDGSWYMLALNAWFRAPQFPKPLVIDFVLAHDCNNAPDCRIRNFEGDLAFHYMQHIEDARTADIAAIIADALHADYRDECNEEPCYGRLPQAMPTLQQFEFVIEVHRAEAAAFVDQLALYVATQS